MRTRSRRVLKLAALQAVAVAIGTAAALGAGGGLAGDSVYADGAHSCVKYAHDGLTRNSWWHPDCQDATGAMAAYNPYQTSSWAWREHNEIGLNEDRWWEVGLFDINGNWYQYAAGSGKIGFVGAVTSVQTRGHCAESPSNVWGYCFVNSHL